jgi:hypothetical protein
MQPLLYECGEVTQVSNNTGKMPKEDLNLGRNLIHAGITTEERKAKPGPYFRKMLPYTNSKCLRAKGSEWVTTPGCPSSRPRHRNLFLKFLCNFQNSFSLLITLH